MAEAATTPESQYRIFQLAFIMELEHPPGRATTQAAPAEEERPIVRSNP